MRNKTVEVGAIREIQTLLPEAKLSSLVLGLSVLGLSPCVAETCNIDYVLVEPLGEQNQTQAAACVRHI